MDRICTIIALNYLPQAMALLESTREIYPYIEFFILITDAESRYQQHLPTAKVLLPEDLDLPTDWLNEMRAFYDPVELATSLKPFLLSTLLTDDVSTVTFLDPDILLFAKLAEGIMAAKSSGIALAPHRLTPSSPQSPGYSELAFLQYGIFNLGYIAVGQKGKPMLAWWGERLRWYCTRFPDDVVFTDQKWMNFIPAYFENQVLRHPGYDFAPWNIDERPLTEVDGKRYSAGMPLIFIHFSQMSGVLAEGNTTAHWEESLNHSVEARNSLQLISQITNDYAAKLVGFRELIKQDLHSQPQKKSGPHQGFHRRRKLIQRSLDSHRSNHPVSRELILPKKNPLIIKKIVLTLEKSATLNGIRKGLSRDIPKISYRLRNFFHK